MGLYVLNQNIINAVLDPPCPLIVRQVLAIISLRLYVS